ncbi:NAD-dependent epimerase/dehydratase family protein [Streptococcus hyovaginalis]|nr:NAD-dependent epimerase/dehydratase family protein [Streptococcus hyovaginalis]MDY4511723.1 NmrA family NAD(P)-binding protein [Streptococcus hyovaginalis]MDY5974825.1 NmrA family NAD(P)-binding protein [Streptococcus hyovaginalis]
MANILLFGASGFLGKAVIRELLKNNHHLTAISRSVDLSNAGKFNLEIT